MYLLVELTLLFIVEGCKVFKNYVGNQKSGNAVCKHSN